MFLFVLGCDVADVRLDPNLQEMQGLGLRIVELAVLYPAACAHTLDVTRADGRAGSSGVFVGEFTRQHIADNFHVAVAIRPKARARSYAILVDDTQGAELHVPRVLVVREGKRVKSLKPAMIGLP